MTDFMKFMWLIESNWKLLSIEFMVCIKINTHIKQMESNLDMSLTAVVYCSVAKPCPILHNPEKI